MRLAHFARGLECDSVNARFYQLLALALVAELEHEQRANTRTLALFQEHFGAGLVQHVEEREAHWRHWRLNARRLEDCLRAYADKLPLAWREARAQRDPSVLPAALDNLLGCQDRSQSAPAFWSFARMRSS